jgi:hypothetical protein
MERTDLSSYYSVNNSVYTSKTQALIEASKSNAFPEWHFGRPSFARMKWDQGHVADIRSVYAARARQLREQYDYLVLSFSGGSDSWTVLNTFLVNNIKLDEVLVYWPMRAIDGKYQVSTVTDTWNYYSEYELVIKKDLEYLAARHPEIKVTIADYSDTLSGEIGEEDWFSVNDHMNPTVFSKYKMMTDTEQKLADNDKSVAVIQGIDKPQLAYKDGRVFLYFLDILANTTIVDRFQNRKVEMFYWSPAYPELAHAQARILYEYFVAHPEHLYLIDWSNPERSKYKSRYDDIVRTLVYPDWDKSKFQAKKTNSNTYNMMDSWVFKDATNYRYYQSWEHGLKNIVNSVDDKFKRYDDTGRFAGWSGFIGPLYELGPVYNVI